LDHGSPIRIAGELGRERNRLILDLGRCGLFHLAAFRTVRPGRTIDAEGLARPRPNLSASFADLCGREIGGANEAERARIANCSDQRGGCLLRQLMVPESPAGGRREFWSLAIFRNPSLAAVSGAAFRYVADLLPSRGSPHFQIQSLLRTWRALPRCPDEGVRAYVSMIQCNLYVLRELECQLSRG
jgi:hypothetical protein